MTNTNESKWRVVYLNADKLNDFDGTMAYKECRAEGFTEYVPSDALDELKAENDKLRTQLAEAKDENEKLYAAHAEWSRNDCRTFGSLALENTKLTEENQRLKSEYEKIELFKDKMALHNGDLARENRTLTEKLRVAKDYFFKITITPAHATTWKDGPVNINKLLATEALAKLESDK